MGYGPIINGKQVRITPWLGSWAQREEARRLVPNPPPLVHNLQWPLGCTLRDALSPKFPNHN